MQFVEDIVIQNLSIKSEDESPLLDRIDDLFWYFLGWAGFQFHLHIRDNDRCTKWCRLSKSIIRNKFNLFREEVCLNFSCCPYCRSLPYILNLNPKITNCAPFYVNYFVSIFKLGRQNLYETYPGTLVQTHGVSGGFY